MATRVTKTGRLAFGSIKEPRSTPFDTVQWDAGLVLSTLDSEELLAIVEEEIAKARREKHGFPATNEKLRLPYKASMKKLEDGTKELEEDKLLWTFKRKYEIKMRNGETRPNNPPVIYDSTGAICTDTIGMIGSGTMLRIVYDTYTYGTALNAGVSFGLVVAQIVTLEGPQMIELEPIEGGFVMQSQMDEDLIPF
jgi:hypothetical protein